MLHSPSTELSIVELKQVGPQVPLLAVHWLGLGAEAWWTHKSEELQGITAQGTIEQAQL